MKAKNIIPIIAGGVLSAGAAAAAYCEIQHLKKVIASQDKVIECYKDESAAAKKTIEGFEKAIEAKNIAIEKTQEYAAALKQSVETRDEVISLQERQIEAFRRRYEVEDLPEADSSASSPSEEPAPAPPKPKKPQSARQEYVFQYDMDFNVVGKYESFADAARSIGLKSQTSIGKVANGKEASAGGYFWSKGVSPLKKFPDKWEITAKTLKNKKRVN